MKLGFRRVRIRFARPVKEPAIVKQTDLPVVFVVKSAHQLVA